MFAFFVVSFGLGFYIIFNGYQPKIANGNKTTIEVDKEEGVNYFAFPYLTVIKTSAMMIGELVRKSRYVI